jgi:hypothetical protein
MSAVRIVLVAAAAILALSAYGGSRYTVVRTSANVEFEAGEWTLLPSEAPEGVSIEGVRAGMLETLAQDAPSYRLAPGEQPSAGAMGVRLVVEQLSLEGPTPSMEARVAFVDSAGATPDEISLSIALDAAVADPATALGQELGRRTAHFIHSREQHHY